MLTFDPIELEEEWMLLEFPGTVRNEWFESLFVVDSRESSDLRLTGEVDGESFGALATDEIVEKSRACLICCMRERDSPT